MDYKVLHFKVTKEMHRAFKLRAAEEGLSMQELIVELIQRGINSKYPLSKEAKLMPPKKISLEVNRSGKPNSCNCPMFISPHSHLEDDGGSYNIRPDIKNISEAVPDNSSLAKAERRKELNKTLEATAKADIEAGKPLPRCCQMKKPCQHWQFDNDNSQWVNSISGEIKEVV